MGNPLTYRENTLTWDFGRRLASFGNVSYTYNEDGIGPFNPFRYRGYYYDPETGRFLNADEYHSAKQSTKRDNVYAYCMNNPIMYSDKDGREAVALAEAVGIFPGGPEVLKVGSYGHYHNSTRNFHIWFGEERTR